MDIDVEAAALTEADLHKPLYRASGKNTPKTISTHVFKLFFITKACFNATHKCFLFIYLILGRNDPPPDPPPLAAQVKNSNFKILT